MLVITRQLQAEPLNMQHQAEIGRGSRFGGFLSLDGSDTMLQGPVHEHRKASPSLPAV